MISMLILVAWMASGFAATFLVRADRTAPLQWAPMAVILGPLWAAVAVDQRAAARDRRSMR